MLTSDDLALVEALADAEARESFWACRQRLHPDMVKGWWVRSVAMELQNFFRQLRLGLRPMIIFMAPPQHGKTYNIEDFVAWASGQMPSLKTVYTSYGEDLGQRFNSHLQRAIDSERYPFRDTIKLATQGDPINKRTQNLINFVGQEGFFRNTTVEGQLRGHGLDLGIVDDPIKSRKEARSPVTRQSVWEWLIDDFFSRFSKNAGFIMILTRTHVEDPCGRWLEKFPQTKVLRYPAIAEVDERYRKKGEALFPEHKPLDFLMLRKQGMSDASWEAEYQQSPYLAGGDDFPIERVGFIDPPVNKRDVKASIRYWDKAGTEGGGKFTAGVRMHWMRDGAFVISDVQHGQWGALKREEIIKRNVVMDNQEFPGIVTWIEQEPGSGGKESAESTIRGNAGYAVFADKVSGADGSKEARAEPYQAQMQGYNIFVVKALWNRPFLQEHEVWPASAYKDQVDGAAGALNKLTLGDSTYDTSLDWVGE